jgi:hypothetical protein
MNVLLRDCVAFWPATSLHGLSRTNGGPAMSESVVSSTVIHPIRGEESWQVSESGVLRS